MQPIEQPVDLSDPGQRRRRTCRCRESDEGGHVPILGQTYVRIKRQITSVENKFEAWTSGGRGLSARTDSVSPCLDSSPRTLLR